MTTTTNSTTHDAAYANELLTVEDNFERAKHHHYGVTRVSSLDLPVPTQMQLGLAEVVREMMRRAGATFWRDGRIKITPAKINDGCSPCGRYFGRGATNVYTLTFLRRGERWMRDVRTTDRRALERALVRLFPEAIIACERAEP